LGIGFKASKKVDMLLNYHYFAITENIIGIDGRNIKKGLGSEVDFQLNWSIMPYVKLMAGYSFMLGTSSMDVVKGGDHKSWQDWCWISLNITPQLFGAK
jgi:hypothetical protein